MPQRSSRESSHEDIRKVIATIDIPTRPAMLTIAMQEGQKDLRRRVALATEDAAA